LLLQPAPFWTITSTDDSSDAGIEVNLHPVFVLGSCEVNFAMRLLITMVVVIITMIVTIIIRRIIMIIIIMITIMITMTMTTLSSS